MNNSILAPGDIVCSSKVGRNGIGTFALKGEIRTSITGQLALEPSSSANAKKLVNIKREHYAKDLVLDVGDIIYGKVTKINYNQAFVDVLYAGDDELPFITKAVIRREDIRESEVDKVVVHDFLKPSDIVRAKVLSLGDNKQYFLTIKESGFGVIVPQSIRDTEI
jgi:exosome complex component CSL4